MNYNVYPAINIAGRLSVPGDKSISHRALILSSMAEGDSVITGLPGNRDVQSTIDCLKELGAEIVSDVNIAEVKGKGIKGFRKPSQTLNAGNSGTTLRLISGLLAFQDFNSNIHGDDSLNSRPMNRIIKPLTEMGCGISGKAGGFPPIEIKGSALTGIEYQAEISSAQQKSAVLIAALGAHGTTVFCEKGRTRDHTEKMMKEMGAEISMENIKISVRGRCPLKPLNMNIPGDFSSAVPFLAAALIVPGSELTIIDVGLNPSRTGFLEIVDMMGGDFTVFDRRFVCGEPLGSLRIAFSRLRGVNIDPWRIPEIIDEIPVIGVLAACAEGETVISGASELRVKESDRISAVVSNLKRLGVDIEEKADGMVIKGGGNFSGGEVDSFKDHRIVMAMAVAACAAEDKILIRDAEWLETSYPGFFSDLEKIRHG